ncbi:MAG: AraC family transcriptional regulator [Clostridia bacterium]|nr:AraC family transcriptional regulator [Clostridia bacterium]
MEKYEEYSSIRKEDISDFRGLKKERFFTPRISSDIHPLEVSKVGITNPDPDYYIKRSQSRCFVLEYVVSGRGHLKVNGEKYVLGANDVYLIHPGDKCEYYSDKKHPYQKYWINFRSYFFADFLKTYKLGQQRVFRNIDISEDFKRLFALEQIADSDDLCLYASAILYEIAFKLGIHVKEKNTVSSIAARVKSELEHSIDVPVALESLEKKFYRTKSDIIKQFKKAYGTTPHAYLLSLRVQAAKNLLANTKKTTKEIAEYLCYSSEYHFSNMFKSKVGVSPKEYRKNNSQI